MSSDIPVKVYVRARPFNKREIEESAAACLNFYVESNQLSCNGKMFAFDSVMDSSTSQETAFEVTTGDIVEKLLKGFNCTIIAYGQTGSGKTYSMGTEETTNSMKSDSRGIIPRLVESLFAAIATSKHSSAFQVLVSMLEIYDEKVNDLLSNTKDLQVREQNGSVLVQGLQRHPVTTLEDTMRQLEVGCQLRSKGETAMNATSSRSHAIFTISVDKAVVDEEDSGFKAKLHLVDLAGSERLKKTQAEGGRMREGININQGLLALGNVISALSEPSGNSKHIPYRDSKITRLLQDSLGGNSFTIMIACVSPADSNAEETLSTLRYADRAKKIKNKPVVNEDAAQASLIKSLQERNRRLEAMLAERESGVDSGVRPEEVQKLEADLAESQRTVRTLETKAAEAFLYKASLVRQLTKLETQKELLKEKLAGDKDDAEAAELLANIRGMLDMADTTMEAGEHQKEGSETPMDVDQDGELDESIDANFVAKSSMIDDELMSILDKMRRTQEDFETAKCDKDNLEKLMKDQAAEKSTLQNKLETLQAEHAKLLTDIKKATTSGKLAEDRRQKVKELENSISSYKKQLNDHKRLEKQKADLDLKTARMQQEIVALKQAQVQNIRKSKEVAEQYRIQKQKHDRQLAQLKAQERKKEVEHVRQKRDNEKKIDVLRKKLEESGKLNKRLIAHQSKKTQIADENSKDATKNLKQFLKQEVAVCMDIRMATTANEDLLKSRRRATTFISGLEKHLKEDQAALAEAKEDGDPARIRSLSAEIAATEAKIQKKREEVEKATDMVKTLGDQKNNYDAEARAEERWANISTVSHAKRVLKMVFDQLLDAKEDLWISDAHAAELRDDLTKARGEVTRQQREHMKALDAISKEKDAMKKGLNAQLLVLSNSIAEKLNASPEDARQLEIIRDRIENAADDLEEAVSAEKEQRPVHENRRRAKPAFYGNVVDSGTIAGTPETRKGRHSKPTQIWERLSPIEGEKEKPRRDSMLFVNPPLASRTNENLNETMVIDDSPNPQGNTTFVIPSIPDKSPRKRVSETENDAPPFKVKAHDVTLGGRP